ncbi:hypothetical protein SDC9_176931 [bioreactor metagenome]|uniref:Uncharacterized protein n=1 Tax=bioreactor metagenome TaxID=1076179 RepID=A0A645GRK1_9ZZZZ
MLGGLLVIVLSHKGSYKTAVQVLIQVINLDGFAHAARHFAEAPLLL